MSQISNRFYVTALEDGTTLHGNLVSDKSLTQAWNNASQSAVPDWSTAANQPTIWVTLLSGTEMVLPDNTGKWYYNGTGAQSEITPSDTRFQITTHAVTYGGQTYNMPALKIVANLASGSNVDVDTITYKGSYTIDSAAVSFEATIQVRISAITAGSNLGIINFKNGISDITSVGQTITMNGILYGGDTGQPVTSPVTTKWYLNQSTTPTSGSTIDGVPNSFQVTEAQVVDHATVRCEFYDASNNLKYTAYAEIDDMQDPEYMYIQYNGNNGNAASLRNGDSAPFQVWIGSRDDAAVRTGWENATYKVQLLDGNGEVITASGLSDIPNPDSGDPNYYRTLNKNNQNKAYFSIAYATVKPYGKNITGIVIATSATS